MRLPANTDCRGGGAGGQAVCDELGRPVRELRPGRMNDGRGIHAHPSVLGAFGGDTNLVSRRAVAKVTRAHRSNQCATLIRNVFAGWTRKSRSRSPDSARDPSRCSRSCRPWVHTRYSDGRGRAPDRVVGPPVDHHRLRGSDGPGARAEIGPAGDAAAALCRMQARADVQTNLGMGHLGSRSSGWTAHHAQRLRRKKPCVRPGGAELRWPCRSTSRGST